MPFEHKLKVNQRLTNLELAKTFGVSTQGGMRRSKKHNCLVITSDPHGKLYNDRWVGKILLFTGMGKSYDQDLTFHQNRTLANSTKEGTQVFLFEHVEPSGYKFLGEVTLVSSPFQEKQPDESGKKRMVWMFPVSLVEDDALSSDWVELDDSTLPNTRAYREGRKRLIAHIRKERNRTLIARVKSLQKWACDICSLDFLLAYDVQYIEAHHKTPLSQAKEEVVVTVNDIALLCPNCHRAIHRHMMISNKTTYDSLKTKIRQQLAKQRIEIN